MAEIPGLKIGISSDASALIAEFRKVGDAATKLQGGFAAAGTALKGLAGGLGVGLSIAGIAQATKATFAWADALKELSERVGVSVEQLQRLQQAGQLTNVSQEQITGNLEKFARGLGDAARGTGTLKKALEDNNIELRNQDGSLRSVSDVFDDYAAAIASAGTEQEALSLAVAGFGRSGAGFVTTLREMSEGMDSFNVLTARQVELLGQYDDKIGRVSERLNFEFKRGLAATIEGLQAETDAYDRAGQAVLRFFDNLAGTDLADAAGEARRAAEGMADFELGVARAGAASAAAAGEVDELSAAVRRARSAGGEGLADVELAASNLATSEARKEVEAFEKGLLDQERASERAARSVAKLVGEQKRLADAGRFLTETSAQEERASAALAKGEKDRAWKREEALKMTKEAHDAVAKRTLREQETMGEALKGIYAGPALDFEDQAATAAMLEKILS